MRDHPRYTSRLRDTPPFPSLPRVSTGIDSIVNTELVHHPLPCIGTFRVPCKKALGLWGLPYQKFSNNINNNNNQDAFASPDDSNLMAAPELPLVHVCVFFLAFYPMLVCLFEVYEVDEKLVAKKTEVCDVGREIGRGFNT